MPLFGCFSIVGGISSQGKEIHVESLSQVSLALSVFSYVSACAHLSWVGSATYTPVAGFRDQPIDSI